MKRRRHYPRLDQRSLALAGLLAGPMRVLAGDAEEQTRLVRFPQLEFATPILAPENSQVPRVAPKTGPFADND